MVLSDISTKKNSLSSRKSFVYQNSLKPYGSSSVFQQSNWYILGRSASGTLLENSLILKAHQIFPQRYEK